MYSEREIAISRTISRHLENFYSALSLAAMSPEESRLWSIKQKASRMGLTRREQQVALLPHERLSMPEIADRLFISCRTVEKHAEHIYGKLGISKKRELSKLSGDIR